MKVSKLKKLIPKFIKNIVRKLIPMWFLQKESAFVHRYLDGLNGIEIGASFQNSYGLQRTGGAYANVDLQATWAQRWQNNNLPDAIVNIVASGDKLPFKDNTLDYVFSSHVIEHFFDPVAAIKEWLRVVKADGIVLMIVPHKERTFDCNRPVTPIEEIMDRHNKKLQI
jgi:SAM-dependent methyltransferase